MDIGSPEQYYVVEEHVNQTRWFNKGSMLRQEISQMDSIMEMFMKMWEEDRKERREIEERREREERDREERREDRQQLMIVQLRKSQFAVQQTVQISQTRFPVMTENDEVEDFIAILEMGLISLGTPRSKWKHQL